ncbi:MAG: hypothetical protein ACRC10_04960 [Thermoguttaceae bacterium]
MPFGLFAPKVGHQALYTELCKVHQLERPVRALLDQMVQVFDMKQPALLFVDPSWFQKAIQNKTFAAQEDLLREVCFKWFGRRV